MNSRLTNSILVVMLLLNLAFIGSWWMSHKREHNRKHHDNMMGGGGPMHNMNDKGMMFMTKQLDFSDDQQTRADKIFRAHSDKMHKQLAHIDQLQQQIFKCMCSDTPDSVHAFMYSDSLGMCRIEVQKELFRSSLAIRQICNADQKKKFDGLMQNISKHVGHQLDMISGPMKRDSL